MAKIKKPFGRGGFGEAVETFFYPKETQISQINKKFDVIDNRLDKVIKVCTTLKEQIKNIKEDK
jgi:hypothetical protein|tara:strand:- start:5080 stop:5271 length:192 start_codon:yes stop_codon:yes gene_type:complete